MASRERPTDAENAVAGQVAAASYLGDRSHLQVHVDGLTTPLAVASQNVLPLVHSTHASERNDVWLSWPSESVVVLPPD